MIRRLLPFWALFLFSAASVRAVILLATGDPSANTTAPTGALANSGWQYEGQFGSFLGTVIGSNYFITAKHIGGTVGQIFVFNNVGYTTTAAFPDPSSDLQIWQVAGTFPIHAPLYSGAPGNEVNSFLTVFGRGTQRGNPVLVGADSHVGGWLWGGSDGVERWGTNMVGSIAVDAEFGQLLRVPFDSGGTSDEAHLSVGDSGGAVFVFNVTTNRWELAGINLAVDGPFSTSTSGANPFNAAMFDTTGLFQEGAPGIWSPAFNPSGFYATEIAAHRRFVESVVMRLVSVASRKTHGSAGTFDVDLPSSGRPGIECRSGGATNDYTIVFTFANNVTVQSANVSAGTASSFSVAANIVTVNLSGIPNAQTATITLGQVNDGTNTSDVEAAISVLIGDTTGNGLVNSSDIAQTQSQTGQPVTADNFREDLTVNGAINSSDIALAQSQSGTGLAVSGSVTAPGQRSSVTPLNIPANEPTRIRQNLEKKRIRGVSD
jgi:hypothetical protein